MHSCVSITEKRVVLCTEMEYFEDDLFKHIKDNDAKAIAEFIKCGLDVNHAFRSTERPERLGRSLIETAIIEEASDVAKLLVNKKCDANITYVVNATFQDCKFQLEEFKKPDRLKLTTMYKCVVYEQVHLIKWLVLGGFDVNVCDERGCSALWHAVDANNYEMVKTMLMSKVADVSKTDNTKLAPLHVAAMRGNVKICSLLIKNGADVNQVQMRGSSPLILACREGDFDTVRLLLLNGADPNHIGYNGHNVISTALQFTTEIRIPELLLNCGALVDKELLDICRKEGKKFILFKEHPEFYHVMKKWGSTPRPMKVMCCLTIRRLLVKSKEKSHLIKKVEALPLPRLIKDFLLFGHV